MLRKRLFLTLLLVVIVLAGVAGTAKAQTPVELRMLWYNDGNEGDVVRALLDKFEKDNPTIKVKVDTIAFADLHNVLQTNIEGGKAPDLVRITALGRFQGQYLDLTSYLKDAKAWEATFDPNMLNWLRTPGGKDKGLYGFPSQFTISGPFINVSLFKQAGVAIPTDGKTTLKDWVKLAVDVAQKTKTPYAVSVDRSAHRLFGPMLSWGATFIDQKTGRFKVDTPAFRDFVTEFTRWHKESLTPKEVWIGAGGTYKAGKDYFVNGELVFYFSGSWQVGAFTKEIGNKFEWQVVDQPCGPAGCSGMPGGAWIMGMKGTKNPKEVAAVMEYLSSEPVLAEFYAKTLFLPGQANLIKKGIDFPASKDALSAFTKQIPKLLPEAYQLQGHPAIDTFNVETRDQLSRVVAGEINIDEAIKRIQAKADEYCDKNKDKCVAQQ